MACRGKGKGFQKTEKREVWRGGGGKDYSGQNETLRQRKKVKSPQRAHS